jgi:hypothetical protein
LLRHLAGSCVVKVNKRLAINVKLQNRKISARIFPDLKAEEASAFKEALVKFMIIYPAFDRVPLARVAA